MLVSNTISNSKQAEMGKRGRVIPLFIILLVIAITVALFFYRDRVAELGNYGYLGAFLISLVSNATIILPMPGFLLLFALGAAFNPILVGLAGAIGGTIGEMTCYMLGYSGRGIARSNKMYIRAEGWMRRWGTLTIFVFTLIPFTPFDLAGMAAGALHFPLWKFFLACLCGKILKYVGIALAGALGWEAVSRGVQPATIAVLAALATGILLAIALAIEDWSWKRGR